MILLAVLLAGVQAAAQNYYPASSNEITYIGRVLEDGKVVKADWSGTMALVQFEGKELVLHYEDTGADYVNIWVDKEPCAEADVFVKLEGSGKVKLANFKKKGMHSVTIQKRTEGECGCLSFLGFETDGVLLQARPWKERVIEIIGDSYTCGYGVESPSRDAPPLFKEENCNKSYSGILGRYFDADVVRIAHSGRGIVRNYGDGDPEKTMPVRYKGTFDEAEGPEWKVSYTPDIVVIYLGTNDFSVRKQPSLGMWCTAYKRLLDEVRENYGAEVPILCVASNIDPMMSTYVEEAAEAYGDPKVFWTGIYKGAHNITSELGGAWHPNYAGMRKVAALMAPYISTLTGWELPFKAVE